MKAIYNIELVIIFLLFLSGFIISPLFWLLALTLMWLWAKWPKPLKVIITIPVLLFFVYIIIGSVTVLSYLYFIRPVQVAGDSMLPTYPSKTYLVTRRPYFDLPLRRADIVVYQAPKVTNKEYISRIIGLPGETILIQEGKVFINKKQLDEPYLEKDTETTNWYVGGATKERQPYKLKNNEYFIMGDNRHRATSDSRKIGSIPFSQINGKVLFCYWNCQKGN